MTDEQATRIAALAAGRASRPAPAGSLENPSRATGRGRIHAARRSRYLALGLSVAALSGLASGMWSQAAASANSQSTTDAVPAVAAPATQAAPDRIVYLVVRRPEDAAAGSLRNQATVPAPATVTVPAPSVNPAPAAPAPAPVTKSHGSK